MFNLSQPASSPFLTRLHEASPPPVRPGEGPPQSLVEPLFDLGPDHHISALFAMFLASRAAALAAEEFQEQIEASIIEPDVPAVLHVREDDAAWFLPPRVAEITPGGPPYYFHPTDVERLQKTAHQLYDVTDEGGDLSPAEVRRRAIVEAHMIWWQKHIETCRRSGVNEAIELRRQAWDSYRRNAHQLARSRPTTLEGALLKARAVAVMAENDPDLAEWQEQDGDGTMSGLAISLTVDLIRLAGLMPPAGEVEA